MPKITLDALEALLSDPSRSEADLSDYFILDETASTAFAPVYTLNPETVEIPVGPEGPERSAAVLNLANWYARMRRVGKYYEKIRSGYSGPVLVSEGDSWFQYPIRLHDTIDKLMETYAVYSQGAAGDLLERMAKKQEYLKGLRETGASVLLLSGGGNDLVAGGALADYLEEYNPDFNPGDYLKPDFQGLLDSAFGYYEQMCRQVRGAFPHVQILCHGYDYPVPNKGRWLGRPMETRGIHDPAVQKAIAAEMMDRFNRGLRRMAQKMPHVTYIDCRGVVGDHRWFDELHPTNEGYADVAARFAHEIRKISNDQARGSARARSAVSGPFGGSVPAMAATPDGSNSAVAVPAGPQTQAKAQTQPQAISLHVGINEVDPDHYAGWDGALVACENDARSMAEIARRQGFTGQTLMTRDATREAVVGQIRAAAAALEPGGMFFLSVACHGGQITDFNRDERPDAQGRFKDETLLLYDFQIIDDELYSLWCNFKPGVRILMVSDCCHSGTNIRAAPPTGAPQPRIRQIPRAYAMRTLEQNLQAYRDYAQQFDQVREDILHNPLSTPLKASVLSLSGCLDHQVAMDGDQNGAFTEALLKVWNKGQFSGDYQGFRRQIDRSMGDPDQTPKLTATGAVDAGFAAQLPFTLWTNPGATVLSDTPPPASPAPAPLPPAGPRPVSPADFLSGTEGDEDDDLTDDEVEAILEGRGGLKSRARSGWSATERDDFTAFIEELGLRHFSPEEFLILGGSHHGSGPCSGKNRFPPRALWPNIANTAQVLDELRARLGKPGVITNAYRAPAYNACIGGAKASLHMQFNAVDFKISGIAPKDVAWALRRMRDDEGRFKGGIGLYNTFVHLDTRGVNRTFPESFRDGAAPATTVLGPRGSGPGTGDRRARIRSMALADVPAKMPRGARSVFRDASAADEKADIALEKQKLNAAVNASSVVSFVENLTPQQKDDVLLSTLFAQRAASAKHDPVSAMEDWLAVYLEALSLLGWSVESAPQLQQDVLKGNASFDQAILKILAVVASQSQFAILEQALGALRGLADGSGQIKLFDQSTSVTEGGHFQVGAAEASGEVISMALGAFHYRWTDERKNVLFVKWGKSEVNYWMAVQKASLSTRLYAEVRDLVSERLNDSRKKLIADIDLG